MRWGWLWLAAMGLISASLARAASEPPLAVSLVRLTPAEMSVSDVAIVAARADDIARSAQIYGYALDRTFSYSQAVCPAATGSILLMYESSSSGGGISRFSAVVPRVKSGRGIEIVPVRIMGAAPFEPAWRNPHSYAVFNQMISPDWRGEGRGDRFLELGLCYMAVVGEPPSALRTPSLMLATIHAPEPTLRVLSDEGLEEVFSVRVDETQYDVWTLAFSRSGALIRADREVHRTDTAPAAQMLIGRTEVPAITPGERVLATNAPAVNTAIASAPNSSVPGQTVALPANETASLASGSTGTHATVPAQAAPREPPHRFVPDPSPPPGRFVPEIKPDDSGQASQ